MSPKKFWSFLKDKNVQVPGEQSGNAAIIDEHLLSPKSNPATGAVSTETLATTTDSAPSGLDSSVTATSSRSGSSSSLSEEDTFVVKAINQLGSFEPATETRTSSISLLQLDLPTMTISCERDTKCAGDNTVANLAESFPVPPQHHEEVSDVVIESVNPHLGPKPDYAHHTTSLGYYLFPRPAPDPPVKSATANPYADHQASNTTRQAICDPKGLAVNEVTHRRLSPYQMSQIRAAWIALSQLTDGEAQNTLNDVLEAEAQNPKYDKKGIEEWLKPHGETDHAMSSPSPVASRFSSWDSSVSDPSSEPKEASSTADPASSVEQEWKMPRLLRREEMLVPVAQSNDIGRSKGSVTLLSDGEETPSQLRRAKGPREFYRIFADLKKRVTAKPVEVEEGAWF